MWRTLISSGWFIMDLHILQMNKTTAVSIWRLVPNFPLLNTALFWLTTQSRPVNTEPLWDALPLKLFTSKTVKKSKYTHPVHSSTHRFVQYFLMRFYFLETRNIYMCTKFSGHMFPVDFPFFERCQVTVPTAPCKQKHKSALPPPQLPDWNSWLLSFTKSQQIMPRRGQKANILCPRIPSAVRPAPYVWT